MALGEEGALSAHVLGTRSGLGAKVQYYLRRLVELDYVAHKLPLSDERPSKRSVRYEIQDPLLRFWFRFVYPHASALAQPAHRASLLARMRSEIDAYFGMCFERLCREALRSIYESEGVRARFEVGEFWRPSAQIDVVGLREDGWTDLGECKWGTVRSSKSMLDDLALKVRAFPNKRGATIQRRVFTRGPKPGRAEVDGVRWHTLEELYVLGPETKAGPRKRRRVSPSRRSK